MANATVGSLTYEFKANVDNLKRGMAQAREQLGEVSRQAQSASREMQRGMENATASTRKLNQQFSTLSLTISSFASRMAATFIRELPQAIAQATENLRSMQEAARALGVSFGSLQGLNKSGSALGIDPGQMNSELVGLAQKLSEAAREGGKLAEFMEANGIAIKDANGNARPFKEVFADIARLISNSGDEVDKLNALKLLGLSEEMQRVFEQAGGDVRKFAEDAGGEISSFQAETLRRYQDLRKDVLAAWEAISTGAINYLSELKSWAISVAEAISAAFRDVMRGIDAAIAAGRRGLGIAAEAVGFGGKEYRGREGLQRALQDEEAGKGGKVGASDFEYRQAALEIGRKKVSDMLAAAGRDRSLSQRTLPGIDVGGARGSIAFPGDGKTAKAHKEAQDAINNYIESLRVAEQTAKADVENWKLGNVEREKAVALAKAEAIATREGKTLTDAQRAAIMEAAGATGRYKDKLEELRETQQRLNAAVREFQWAVTNALEDVILRGGKAKDVLASLAKELASSGLRQGIGSIFGDTNGKSQGGGLLGSLVGAGASALGGLFGGGKSGLFSGPFKFTIPGMAEGGTLGAGKWAITGEAGPELIQGPATVTPFDKMGGIPNIVIHNNAAVDVTPQMTPQGLMLMIDQRIGQNNKAIPGILADAQRRRN